jgi:hypothetical protein
MVVREAYLEAEIVALESYRSTLRQTNLRTDVEESLRQALR